MPFLVPLHEQQHWLCQLGVGGGLVAKKPALESEGSWRLSRCWCLETRHAFQKCTGGFQVSPRGLGSSSVQCVCRWSALFQVGLDLAL